MKKEIIQSLDQEKIKKKYLTTRVRSLLKELNVLHCVYYREPENSKPYGWK